VAPHRHGLSLRARRERHGLWRGVALLYGPRNEEIDRRQSKRNREQTRGRENDFGLL
jgi:hypothetical protein